MSGQIDFWNDRYGTEGFAYGTEPNDFLKECIENVLNVHREIVTENFLRKRALCLCDGEGRNSIFLARNGYSVDSVDLSAIGMEKLNKWAKNENLAEYIHTTVANLEAFIIKENEYDLIVSISAHVPIPLRQNIHNNIFKYLKSGGHFVLEAYNKKNVGRGIGGPQTDETCMDAINIREELLNLNLIKCEDLERFVLEGQYHKNDTLAAVVQCLAVKNS